MRFCLVERESSLLSLLSLLGCNSGCVRVGIVGTAFFPIPSDKRKPGKTMYQWELGNHFARSGCFVRTKR